MSGNLALVAASAYILLIIGGAAVALALWELMKDWPR